MLKLIIRLIAKIGNTNLAGMAYELKGIGLRPDPEFNGEINFLQKVLPQFIAQCPLVLDVGANIGSYTQQIRKHFPLSEIHSFEPSKLPFESLSRVARNDPKIHCYNFGLGSAYKKLVLFKFMGGVHSSHGSLYPNVLSELRKQERVDEEVIQLNTLDQVVLDLDIQKIDFLKIDVEGHELEVLKGAKNTLSTGKIKVIQFEFNEMNIYSRCYLRDFYNILGPNFKFYRIHDKGLVPLGKYTPKNEVFIYQNIVAILDELEYHFNS